MTSPPISLEALEVLKALALELRLERRPSGGWNFVGSSQKPDHSGVDETVMRELIESDLVLDEQDGLGVLLSVKGKDVVEEYFASAVDGAISWWESRG
jgi:hypothetical protein